MADKDLDLIRETAGPLVQTSEAIQQIIDRGNLSGEVMRSLALARTKIEEAAMWRDRAELLSDTEVMGGDGA